MLHLNDKHKLNWTIDSAGTANYHVDEAPDKEPLPMQRRMVLTFRKLRARQFSVEDFESFDRILVMDQSNLQNVLRLAKHEEHKKKVDLFLMYCILEQIMRFLILITEANQILKHVFQLVYKACDEMRIKYSK